MKTQIFTLLLFSFILKSTNLIGQNVITNISMRIGDGCIIEKHNHISPDNNPTIVNKEELEKEIKIDVENFNLYRDPNFTITYSYIVHVDKNGSITDLTLANASNLWSKDLVDIGANKLIFEKALKDSKPIECMYFVWFRFNKK